MGSQHQRRARRRLAGGRVDSPDTLPASTARHAGSLTFRLLFGAGSRKLRGRARRESWLLAWDCKSHASRLARFDSLGAHLRQTHAACLDAAGFRGRIAAQGLLVLGGLREQDGIGDCPGPNTQNQEAFLLSTGNQFSWRPPPKKRAIPAASRRALATRHGINPGKCGLAYCAKCGKHGSITWHTLRSGLPSSWVTFNSLEIDHIHPRSKGGSHSPENLQLLCAHCNRSKGDK